MRVFEGRGKFDLAKKLANRRSTGRASARLQVKDVEWCMRDRDKQPLAGCAGGS